MKVAYVDDKTMHGGFSTPSEMDLTKLIRDHVDSWIPPTGPNWSDIAGMLTRTYPARWVVYTAASGILMAIIVAAFLIGTALQSGSSAPQQVQVHVG